eukprot:5948682-Pleurochrysis_carterae.AAC.1
MTNLTWPSTVCSNVAERRVHKGPFMHRVETCMHTRISQTPRSNRPSRKNLVAFAHLPSARGAGRRGARRRRCRASPCTQAPRPGPRQPRASCAYRQSRQAGCTACTYARASKRETESDLIAENIKQWKRERVASEIHDSTASTVVGRKRNVMTRANESSYRK